MKKKRAAPGSTGKGKYLRIVVRPKSRFVTFRAHDVGKKGHLIRLAGKTKAGNWLTQAWLVAKTDAKKVKGKIVVKDPKIKAAISKLQTKPKKVKADIYKAKPRKNIPERSKPTKAMRKALKKNIKKAQAARKKRTKKKK